MEEQRTRARASWKGGAKEAANPAYAKLAETFKTEPDFILGRAQRTAGLKRSFFLAALTRADTKARGGKRAESRGERARSCWIAR